MACELAFRVPSVSSLSGHPETLLYSSLNHLTRLLAREYFLENRIILNLNLQMQGTRYRVKNHIYFLQCPAADGCRKKPVPRYYGLHRAFLHRGSL